MTSTRLTTSDSSRYAPPFSATPKPSASAPVSLLLMVLLTSTTAPSARMAVQEMPIAVLPLIRFGSAGLCLLPAVLWRGRRGLTRLFIEDWPRLLIAASLCIPINQALFLNGAKLAPTMHVGLLYAACPLVVLIVAILIGQENLTRPRLMGILLTVLGVAGIALGAAWEGALVAEGADPDPDVVRRTLLGDAAIVGAVLSWGMYMALSRPLILKHGALTTLAGVFLTGSLLQVPLGLMATDVGSRLAQASTTSWLALTYLSLIVTVLGLWFQNRALQRYEASLVAAVGNVAPLLTVLWSIWLFDERLTTAFVLGALLILVGVGWARRQPKPSRARALT